MIFKLEKILLLTIIITLASCTEHQADIENVKQYENNGITFEYPGNWEVSEDIEESGFRYLFVEAPREAILKIEIYPKKESFTLLEFIDLDIKGFESEVPTGFTISDKSAITKTQKLVSGKLSTGYKYSFNLSALGTDVPHVQEYYMLNTDSKSVYVMTNVADEDLHLEETGFELILKTIKLKNTQ